MKPLRAAIYARRSTDEHQVESLATQFDNARRFAIAKGYHVDPRHEFADTASRAEFAPKRRPGFAALREAALEGNFDVIIARDDSRLGGDMLRVATFAQEMTDADVRIVFYSTGEEMMLENETSRLMAVMRGFASESERRKISSRTRESAERKARRGLVAGGVVYGYRNALAPDGSGKVREIDEHQATIVREVFERYAKGEGLRSICKTLTERKIPSPRAGKRGIGAWVPSAVHAMLRRPLYIGRVEWGRVHKTYKSGTRVRTKAHRHELVVIEAPHLRIISEDLWNAVQARVKVQETPEKRGGRPATYLLSGVLRCSTCHGPISVINGKQGKNRIKVYTCCRRRDRDGMDCPSTLRREVDSIDSAVVDWVRDQVLTEEYIVEVIAEARRQIESRESTRNDAAEQLERQARKLHAEIDKFAELAAEAPHNARSVFYTKIAERQKQLDAIESRLRATSEPAITTDVDLEKELREQLDEFHELVERNPGEMRAFLKALFPEGLSFAWSEEEGGRGIRLEEFGGQSERFGVIVK